MTGEGDRRGGLNADENGRVNIASESDLKRARHSQMNPLLFNVTWLLRLWSIAAVCIAKEFYDNTRSRWRQKRNQVYSSTQKGHVAIVTGGSRGIGLEVVKNLLSQGVKVIVGSSSEEQCEKLAHKMKEENPQGEIEVWRLNLKSMKSVRNFAEKFLASELPLHFLINNAGIMFVPYEVTEDGLESHFSVNYLGHCLLTRLLLPKLSATGTTELHSRIVNVTSCVYATAQLNLSDLQGKETYSPYHSYMQSKLAQIMFTFIFQEHLKKDGKNIDVYSVHPGIVNTNLHNNVWWAPKSLNNLYKTPEEGAENVLAATLSPDLEGRGGSYIEKGCITQTTSYSMNRELQKHLWDQTWKILQAWLN